jgi:hypothetical protein
MLPVLDAIHSHHEDCQVAHPQICALLLLLLLLLLPFLLLLLLLASDVEAGRHVVPLTYQA